MEALLIDEWIRASAPEIAANVELVRDDASLAVVRDRIRAIGTSNSVASEVIDRACLVASEIGRNQLRHAVGGRIGTRVLTRSGTHRGIEVLGVDRGKGIASVASALDSAPRRSQGSLGVGVGSIRRLSTEVDFDIRMEEGTRIAARLFERGSGDITIPRRREVGIYGRPIEGETISGDHASFLRRGEGDNEQDQELHLVLCDGLGHGLAARDASSIAIRVFDERIRRTALDPLELVTECHAAMEESRGGVLATVSLTGTHNLCAVSVGNIDVQIVRPRSTRRLGGSSAMVGGQRMSLPPKSRVETGQLTGDEVLVMASDGIQSRMSIDQELMLLRAHPIVIAQHIFEKWSRPTDDTLVVVVR